MALAVAACRSGSDGQHAGSQAGTAPTARVERGARAYRAGSLEGARSIDVLVRFATRRDAPSWPIPKMVQSQCAGADHVTDEALSASSDGGAEGAVVWLDDVREGRPLVPATIAQDEKRCTFTPHVLALAAGGTVTLSNGDPSNHAVRFDFAGDDPPSVMKTLPAGASLGLTVPDEWAGKVARVSCPIHLWMYGYALFFDHPYFAVTRGGAAKLEGVPPGTHHLVVWHEGTTSTYDSSVKLSAPRTERVEVVVAEADVRRSFVIEDDGSLRAE